MNYEEDTFEELIEKSESLAIQIDSALDLKRPDVAQKYAKDLQEIFPLMRESRAELHF